MAPAAGGPPSFPDLLVHLRGAVLASTSFHEDQTGGRRLPRDSRSARLPWGRRRPGDQRHLSRAEPVPEHGRQNGQLLVAEPERAGRLARCLLLLARGLVLLARCLVPPALCLERHRLHFIQPDGEVVTFGYSCNGDRAFLRGDQPYWQGMEVHPPENFQALLSGQLQGPQE